MAGGNSQDGLTPGLDGGGESSIIDDLKAKAADAAGVSDDTSRAASTDKDADPGSGGASVLGRFSSDQEASQHLQRLEAENQELKKAQSSAKSEAALGKMLSGGKPSETGDGKPASLEDRKNALFERAKKTFDGEELSLFQELAELQTEAVVAQRVGPVEQELQGQKTEKIINSIKSIPDWDKHIESAEAIMKAENVGALQAFELAAARSGSPITAQQAEDLQAQQRFIKESSNLERGSDVSYQPGSPQNPYGTPTGDTAQLEKALNMDRGQSGQREFFGVE